MGVSIGKARAAEAFSCQIEYSGEYGQAPLSAKADSKEALINKMADQCLQDLRGQSSAHPEDIAIECANVVVSGC